jgi:acetyl esterase/lipase
MKGPARPGWNWFVEVATEVLRNHLIRAFNMDDAREARLYLDSVVFDSPALRQVKMSSFASDKIRGDWVVPKQGEPAATLLYFHGGGYSFYPKAYSSVIALITVAAKCKTFALDYRLSPEHRFPAQLEDALNAYRWLLENGSDPDKLIVGGDSAGANLTLALLLAARERRLPLPALAVVLSPPTDFDPPEDFASSETILANEEFDYIDRKMLVKWAEWFCEAGLRRDPLVSPLHADLRGLPPIYMQAGGAEILFDSIQRFADHARDVGADVTLESWADMNHVFQAFGYDAPQSRQALTRIGEVIAQRVGALKKMAGM